LDELYRDVNSAHWQYKEGVRCDWGLAENWLKRVVGEKILDVGCWDGGFLVNLPRQWKKFGIEINEKAVARAQSVGVNIIEENVYQSHKNFGNFFDVVTAFDIIEHVEDPGFFLDQLIKYTRPGGYILIGTGNTDAWQWRMAKSRYWYCWPAEHISFINRTWFEKQQHKLPFEILDMKNFSHSSQPSITGLILQSFENFLYLFVPVFFYKIRLLQWRLLGKPEKKIVDYPPAWHMSRDHLLIILQKSSPKNIGDE
jgi:2-polyprenyl-3-methyl-5-hydroxy-6-metoxy-1,4-benzoquinol methylase